MRVGLMLDRERLLQEHATLSRLAVGLLVEGVAVTRLVPDTFDPFAEDVREKRLGLMSRIAYPARTLPWLRGATIDRLGDVMDRSMPDLFHVVGEEAWRFSVALGARLDRPVVLDIWATRQVATVPAGRHARSVAAYITPTQPIADALARRVDPSLVHVVPPGVSTTPERSEALAHVEDEVMIAVIGEGRDLAAYRDLLTGIRQVVTSHRQVQVVLEIRGPHGHDVWRQARQLELLPAVSSIADAAALRSAILQCDIVVVPEQTGALRTVLLEAMSAGVPVVAAQDPDLQGILDPDTAELIEARSPERWAQAIGSMIENPPAARRRALHAGQVASGRFRSSEQVERLMSVYAEVLADPALPFAPSGGDSLRLRDG